MRKIYHLPLRNLKNLNAMETDPRRAHICQKYHKLHLWRKNCHVEKVWEILEKIWEILGDLGKF